MELTFNYQKHSPNLEKLVSSIDRPGEFCTNGAITCPMPTLRVDGVGILSFPIPEFQIDQLIAVADQAPYGKGADTIVDISVRNCLEINPHQISVGGKGWNKTLSELVSAAAAGLGCEADRLSAELYKILIYEPGGFFLPHRDTEKSDGMIATLTVSLPVVGTGGELVVRQKSKEKTIDLSTAEPSQLMYAAFYSDCEHEIKKVSSGNRVSIVYNLCITADDSVTARQSPDYTQSVDALADELAKWCNNDQATDKLIWILEHQYSESGLSFNTMKNGDLAVASALSEAVAQVPECEIYAANLEIQEQYYAYDNDGYHYDSYGSSGSDFEIDEFIEGDIDLNNWVSVSGSKPNFGSFSISDGEVMPQGALDDLEPNEENFEGYTGNAGATVDLLYNLSALVLFKREQMISMLTERGCDPAVAWINEEIRQNNGKSSDSIVGLAKSLIDNWQTPRYSINNSARQGMLRALGMIKDRQLAKSFLHQVAIPEYQGSDNSQFIKVVRLLNSTDMHETLISLLEEKFVRHPQRVLDLLLRIESRFKKSDKENHRFLFQCAEVILAKLPACLAQMQDRPKSYWPKDKHEECEIQPKTVKCLFMFLLRADAADIALSAAEILTKHTSGDLAYRVIPRALVKLQAVPEIFCSIAYAALWKSSTKLLLQRSDSFPEGPKDWRRPSRVSCDCELCCELSAFCDNRNKKTTVFAIRRDLRGHVRDTIETDKLDIDCRTERTGSPHKLVLTKNQASYKRRLNEYADDIKIFGLQLQTVPITPNFQNKVEYESKIKNAMKRATN